MAEEVSTQPVQGIWGEEITQAPAPTETPEQEVQQEAPVETQPEQDTTTDTPDLPPAAKESEPIIQEKVVEKIVEKYPEFADEYSKAFFEKLLKGGEEAENEIYSYLSEKKKDYSTMSDLDVVRENLKKENPQWSAKDIDAEVRFKYGKEFNKVDLSEIDRDEQPEEYARAEKHNEEVERRELMLERDARDARYTLESSKKNLQLPQIQKEAENAPKAELTPEQVDELNRKWEAQVEAEVPQLSDFKFKIGGEEVTYKVTDDEKRALTASMKDFEVVSYLQSRGWFDAEGNPNILKITEDRYKLENLEKMMSSSASKVKAETTKEVVAEIKNVDLTKNRATTETNSDIGASIWS